MPEEDTLAAELILFAPYIVLLKTNPVTEELYVNITK